GKSSRMGTDKAFVEILGKPMIEHLLEQIGDVGQESTLIIANRPDNYAHLGLPIYSDFIPDKGSLGGIYTAIHYSPSLYTFVIACDMPFVRVDLVRYMIGLCETGGYDVIVPRVDNYPQGLHAIYNRSCLEPIRRKLDADRLKVIGFYDDVDVRVRYLEEHEYRRYDPHGHALQNINTPNELAEARRLAGEEG
ncbi:MAG TPA: molybdenum cofactor guanylyltransferase, partial [Aggregatilineales bacterium]|nr:molybdenum cofactor guanylyltransferase [Aggregatilineales bacterium]